MRVWEFEEAVLRIEEVLVRVRAPVNTEVGDYDFERKASRNMTVTQWVATRLSPRLGDLEVAIIDGSFTHPHGRTKIETLRSSYDQQLDAFLV